MAEINAAMPVFQFQPETVRSSGAGASGAAPRLGVSGGEGSRAGVEIIADTRDLGAGSSLPAFLEEAFAPKLKAVQQQKFRSGFTAARAGKSAADIHAEQPWYAHIFGPTSYELGAETFAVQKAASDMETQFIERLPELRKMSPEEVGVEHLHIRKVGGAPDIVRMGDTLGAFAGGEQFLFRKGADRLPPCAKVVPERSDRGGARHPQGHADDCDVVCGYVLAFQHHACSSAAAAFPANMTSFIAIAFLIFIYGKAGFALAS